MDKVSSLLPRVLHKRGLHKHANASLVVLRAQEWLQKNLRKYEKDLHVRKLQEGTLVIEAANSIAAQECQQCKEALLEDLRKDCKDLKDVRISRV